MSLDSQGKREDPKAGALQSEAHPLPVGENAEGDANRAGGFQQQVAFLPLNRPEFHPAEAAYQISWPSLAITWSLKGMLSPDGGKPISPASQALVRRISRTCWPSLRPALKWSSPTARCADHDNFALSDNALRIVSRWAA